MSIPHLAVPLRLSGTGGFATVEQDGIDDVAQCVAAVIATPEGSRVEAPDFGCPRLEFTPPSPEQIVAAVQEWEPRADLTVEAAAGLGPTETLTQITANARLHL